MVLMFVLAAMLAVSAERPTRNGDPIGIATMHADGTIVMQLRSVECNGTIAEGLTRSHPAEATYGMTIAWIGGIHRGQTKTVIARDLEPCKSR